jgi:hypothetical protein
METNLNTEYGVILKRKIDYYGKTPAAYELAAQEYAARKIIIELEMLMKETEKGKNMWSLMSDRVLDYKTIYNF